MSEKMDTVQLGSRTRQKYQEPRMALGRQVRCFFQPFHSMQEQETFNDTEIERIQN